MSGMLMAVWAFGPVAVIAAFLLQAADDVGVNLDQPTPFENWQVIVGFLLPVVMACILQSGWRRELQAGVTLAVSLIATALARFFMGEYGPIPEAVIEGLKLFAISIPFYYGLWKPSGIAPKIEAATTLSRA